jgi:nitrous oxidase accessory protein NosD
MGNGALATAITSNRIYNAHWGNSGIFVGSFSSAPLINDNQIYDNKGCGIEVDPDASRFTAVITGNRVFRNGRCGIKTRNKEDEAIFEGNQIFDNGESGIITTGRQVTIHDNEIFGNRQHGINVSAASMYKESSSLTIFNNRIYDNWQNGLLINSTENANNIVIRRNSVINNDGYGIVLYVKACGFKDAPETFKGTIEGVRNEVRGNYKGDLCPPYPGPPWPEGFK